MTPRTDLLPCPFCGGKAELDSYENAPPHTDSFRVECPDCEATFDYLDTLEKAIAAWNRRTPVPEPKS